MAMLLEREIEGQSATAGADLTAGDANAISLGYTRLVHIEGGMQGGEFLVSPAADLDGTFPAWGVDWQEWAEVQGWTVLIEEVEA